MVTWLNLAPSDHTGLNFRDEVMSSKPSDSLLLFYQKHELKYSPIWKTANFIYIKQLDQLYIEIRAAEGLSV